MINQITVDVHFFLELAKYPRGGYFSLKRSLKGFTTSPEEAWRTMTTGVTIWIIETALCPRPLITVFDFSIINGLLTLVRWCEGAFTIPTVHFSLPTPPWRGIEGGVPHSTPQGFLGRAAASKRTSMALHWQPTGCAAGLAAIH